MSDMPKHSVTFFALDANGSYTWDQDDRAIVDRIVKTDDLDEAIALHRAAFKEIGSHSAASINPAVELFDNLADYLRALNVGARLSEEFPEDGTFISALTEDLPYWAEIGVTTPQNLADYLDGCFEREMEKAAFA
jgi:hypothetical protein